MIHILTTTNYPGLEIEFNEAWFWSAEGDLTAETFAPYNLGDGWTVDTASHTAVWTQYWPNGQKRVESTWNIWPTPRDIDPCADALQKAPLVIMTNRANW